MSWLNAKRAEALSADLAHLQAFVRQVTEAFEVISLLDLRTPAKDLREKYVRWRAWVELMVLSPARDALGGYLHTLAATQPLIADVVAEPDSLAPLWMRLCREAGASYPKSYLQIGLLGLRRLPQALARGESPWIAGLAHWALDRDPREKEFMRAWLPIKTLCPAAPKVMRRRVFDVLSQKPFVDAGIESPGWWAHDPDFPKTQDANGRRQALLPPPPDLHESIIADLKHGALYADVRARIQNLVKEYKRYTQATGDHYYLVRSFCNVGNVLIKKL